MVDELCSLSECCRGLVSIGVASRHRGSHPFEQLLLDRQAPLISALQYIPRRGFLVALGANGQCSRGPLQSTTAQVWYQTGLVRKYNWTGQTQINNNFVLVCILLHTVSGFRPFVSSIPSCFGQLDCTVCSVLCNKCEVHSFVVRKLQCIYF